MFFFAGIWIWSFNTLEGGTWVSFGGVFLEPISILVGHGLVFDLGDAFHFFSQIHSLTLTANKTENGWLFR